MLTFDDFVSVLSVMGPLAVGTAFGYWLGPSPLKISTALGIGGLLTAGGLAIWYLDAPKSSSASSDCYECSEYWGRLMDETMFTVWVPLTVLLWAIGVVLGASRRHPRSGMRPGRPDSTS